MPSSQAISRALPDTRSNTEDVDTHTWVAWVEEGPPGFHQLMGSTLLRGKVPEQTPLPPLKPPLVGFIYLFIYLFQLFFRFSCNWLLGGMLQLCSTAKTTAKVTRDKITNQHKTRFMYSSHVMK